VTTPVFGSDYDLSRRGCLGPCTAQANRRVTGVAGRSEGLCLPAGLHHFDSTKCSRVRRTRRALGVRATAARAGATTRAVDASAVQLGADAVLPA
jgi:hypothetical protein